MIGQLGAVIDSLKTIALNKEIVNERY